MNPHRMARGLLLAVAATLLVLLPIRRMVASNGDQSVDFGPSVVIMNVLEDKYEPVPFDHLAHARMAEMGQGCVACHHRSPQPTNGDGATSVSLTSTPNQASSSAIPACRSCHPISAADATIDMPGLKGAYHRQCLNCHKEWMHENACSICHLPKEGGQSIQHEPSPDDIVGRMHPPIPEPDEILYRTRFTPADGGNVLFRHKVHTVDYGHRCVECHREDNCSHCHGGAQDTTEQKPLKPGMTWEASHGSCMSCHSEARCQHCHFKDGAAPPPVFQHLSTGQLLDTDHEAIACRHCHEGLVYTSSPNCGTAACHKVAVEYPTDLPGPLVDPATGVEEAIP